MNPPPPSPDPDYQPEWDEDHFHALPNSLPTLSNKLNEEIANNSASTEPFAEPMDQTQVVGAFQALNITYLEDIPEETAGQEMDEPRYNKENVEPCAMPATKEGASTEASPSQAQNTEETQPARGRFYSISDTEAPDPLLAPPPSPVMNAPQTSDTSDTEIMGFSSYK
ncbi:hypothetical protein EYZ11_006768 [Aspergillus tanneri]|uniref:Uncharacterized protein n=1 Tax=Aspergillus tanneri TaxID=1220188 RepID=A0A4S3JF05_9EURO|nr:uncharacterized protein ATNIH1004_006976 [Aspergillus tanneri]KAA8645557.1 hypothetical protein ATNIH1004_006976 [Aspergillus tanneri]THC93760.1 hypothetical protein EYZ11_006768 [Aspergillus tanneri]